MTQNMSLWQKCQNIYKTFVFNENFVIHLCFPERLKPPKMGIHPRSGLGKNFQGPTSTYETKKEKDIINEK